MTLPCATIRETSRLAVRPGMAAFDGLAEVVATGLRKISRVRDCRDSSCEEARTPPSSRALPSSFQYVSTGARTFQRDTAEGLAAGFSLANESGIANPPACWGKTAKTPPLA